MKKSQNKTPTVNKKKSIFNKQAINKTIVKNSIQ